MARFRIIPDSSTVWIDMRTNLHGAHVETNGLEGFLDAELADGRIDLATPSAARRWPRKRVTTADAKARIDPSTRMATPAISKPLTTTSIVS